MVGGSSGTESIVLNGGYADDIDLGSLIVYTGQGGQSETGAKVQVRDQVLERGNLGLKVSHEQNLPVRVIRGYKGDPAYSPAAGYRYDGLYRVTYFGTGTSNGYLIYRATLEAISGEVNPDLAPPNAGRQVRRGAPAPAGIAAPGSKTRTATAVERQRAVSAWAKNLYSDECQLCGITLTVPGGTSSAGAHIRPLGGSARWTGYDRQRALPLP
jgi:putative restriction endonuclease